MWSFNRLNLRVDKCDTNILNLLFALLGLGFQFVETHVCQVSFDLLLSLKLDLFSYEVVDLRPVILYRHQVSQTSPSEQ